MIKINSKRIIKGLVAGVLSAAMVLGAVPMDSLGPISVFAANTGLYIMPYKNYAPKIYVSDIKEAIKEIEKLPQDDIETLHLDVDLYGIDIYIDEDLTLGSSLKVPPNAITRLHLNNHTLRRNKKKNSDGEVLYLEEGSKLIVYDGYIKDGYSSTGGGNITMNSSSNLTLNNVTVSDGYADNSDGYGGGIYVRGNNCNITLNSSTIANNVGDNYGGGIAIGGNNCYLKMNSSKICKNKADDDCGGGIFIKGSNCLVEMSEDSSICENRSYDEGGAIAIYGKSANIIGGEICHNSAQNDEGGAIYTKGSGYVVSGANIHDNNSGNGKGGAIYCDTTGKIMNCKITGNKADNEGGAIYVNKDTTVTGCTIRDNKAKDDGGGIFVSAYNDIYLGGISVIKNNSPNNLYLNRAIPNAYLSGNVEKGSEVWVTANSSKDKIQISKTGGPYRTDYFKSDDGDYYIQWERSPGDRILYLKKGKPGPENSDPIAKEVNIRADSDEFFEDVGNYDTDYSSYPLYKGVFSYASVNGDADYDATFFYSDGFFAYDDVIYNDQLATLSLSGAMATFGATAGGSDDYSNKFVNIKQFLANIGCENVYISDTYTTKPSEYSIGYAIGRKDLIMEDDDYVLVPVFIRGAGYEMEWTSNVSLGADGEAFGFATAATQVEKALDQYIISQELTGALNEGRVKFWICGYSRAGATSNLLAKRVVEKYKYKNGEMTSNGVYAYTFEAPQGGVKTAEKLDESAYDCIHNVVNNTDIVPNVAPKDMGFMRYGKTHYMPGNGEELETPLEVDYSDNNTEYVKLRKYMIKQLGSINPGITFDDYFHKATINYVSYGLGGVLNARIGDGSYKQSAFTKDFFPNFIKYSLECNLNDGREYYSNRPIRKDGVYEGQKSPEEVLKTIIPIVFGRSPESTKGIMRILNNANNKMDGLHISTTEIYRKVIGNWNKLSADDRSKYDNKFRNLILYSSDYGEGIDKYLTLQEFRLVEGIWDDLLQFLLTYIGNDYNKNNQDDVGTMMYNAANILESHYPEVTLSWVRTYDYLYDDIADTRPVIKLKSISSVNAKEEEMIVENTDTSRIVGKKITLDCESKGSAIYYSLDGKTFNLYRDGIELEPRKNTETGEYEDVNVTITTYAMRFGMKSMVKTFNYSVNAPVKIVDSSSGREPLYYSAGQELTLEQQDTETQYFNKWTFGENVKYIKGNKNSSIIVIEVPDVKELSYSANMSPFIKEIELRISPIVSEEGLPDSCVISSTDGKEIEVIQLAITDDKGNLCGISDSKENFNTVVKITNIDGSATDDKNNYKFDFTNLNIILKDSDGNDMPSNGWSITATERGADSCAVKLHHDTINGSGSTPASPSKESSITVECYDLGLKEGLIHKEIRQVIYLDADDSAEKAVVYIPAPEIEDEAFAYWEVYRDSKWQAASSNPTLRYPIDGDVTLRAVYRPIVSGITLKLKELVPGDELNKDIVEKAEVTITEEYDITDYIIVDWEQKDIKAGYNKNYTCHISLDKDAPFSAVLTKDSELIVVTDDGKELGADVELGLGFSNEVVVCVTLPTTQKGKYMGAISPSEELTFDNGTVAAEIASSLPKTAQIYTENNGIVETEVRWDSFEDKYDSNSKTESTFTVTGKVIVPDEYDNTEDESTEVTVHVRVSGIPGLRAPRVLKAGGNYYSDIYVELMDENDNDNVEIYWTIDDSVTDIVAGGHKYNADSSVYIEMGDVAKGESKTVTLRAVAKCDGYINSSVAIEEYTFINPIPTEITSDEVTVEGEYTFDTNYQMAEVKVVVGDEELIEGDDYIVGYDNNINAGEAIVYVTGINRYEGTVEKTFTIAPANIDELDYEVIPVQKYTGAEIKPKMEVSLEKYALSENVDYTASYYDNIDEGEARIEIDGMGNFTGHHVITFLISDESEHRIELVHVKNPTCEEPGEDVVICRRCGMVIERGIEVEPLGHDYVNGICQRDGVISLKRCEDIRIDAKSVMFNEKSQTPEVIVTYKDKTLSKDVDYTLSVEPKTEIGSYDLIIEGIGEYRETVIKKWSILPKNGLYCEDIPAQIYTGKTIKPEVRLYNNGILLVAGKDYTASYGTHNINVAAKDAMKNGKSIAPSVTITGKGNYKDKKTVHFSIIPYDISRGIEVDDMTVAMSANNNTVKVAPIVKINGRKLKAGTNYVISTTPDESGTITALKDPGDYELYVVGKNNYSGVKKFHFTITKKILTNKVTVKKIPDQKYDNGNELRPLVEISYMVDGKKTDISNAFIINYKNNTEVGRATVIITAKEGTDYAGSKKVDFKITGEQIEKTKLGANGKGKISVGIYNGMPYEPAIDLYYGTTPLTKDTDYTVSYEKNVNAGTATAIIKGKGKYTGTKRFSFKIDKYNAGIDSENRISVNNNDDISVSYVKGGSSPELVLSMNGIELMCKKDYMVNYTRNKSVAAKDASIAPTATITFMGNLSGKKSIAFTITSKDIAECKMIVPDMVVSTKANGWKQTKIKVVDTNGKNLSATTDYAKDIKYYSDEACTREITDTTLDAGTTVYAKINGANNYTGSLVGSYYISKQSIADAMASIKSLDYSGNEICPTVSDITVTIGSGIKKQTLTAGEDYVVIPGSYKNNVNKGKASVAIRGVGNYCGTKEVNFTIKNIALNW